MKSTISLLAKTCALSASLSAFPGNAAEFSNDDILPTVSSLVFTREEVLVTLESSTFIGNETMHFVARRTDYEFSRVDSDSHERSLDTNFYHRRLNGNIRLRERDGLYDLVERGLSLHVGNGCTPDSRATTWVSHHEFAFAIELQCGARISDAVLNNDRVWMATFVDPEYAYAHDISQQGVIVTSLEGNEEERIAVGNHAIQGLAADPWTNDVWIVTEDRLVQASVDREARRQFWPVLDFAENDGRPVTYIRESPKRVQSNPLAVVSLGLGESHYQKFYDAIKELPDSWDQDIMYHFAMNGPNWVSMPMLPRQLNVLIDDAEPTGGWRAFVCLLDDERAEKLCSLDLDMWP